MPTSEQLLKQLEVARRDLLELSTQNRLLDTKRDQDSGLSLEIEDELADQVFRLLVTDAQPMRFEQGELAAVEAPVEEAASEAEPLPEGATADGEDAPKKRTAKRPVAPKTTAKRVTKKSLSVANMLVSAKPISQAEQIGRAHV